MSEKQEGSEGRPINVSIGTVTFEVTGMRGRTVAYLRGYLLSQALLVASDPPTIFTMGPTESDPAAIVKREDVMRMQEIPGGLNIMQGWMITVGAGYVLSPGDVEVQFGAVSETT